VTESESVNAKTVVVQGLLGCVFLAFLGAGVAGAQGKYILIDDIDQWRVEPFCGSPAARHFLQGPRPESGASGIVTFDRRGNAYVACGTFIQVVTPDGHARVLAGSPGVAGHTDGPPWKATFGQAAVIAMADDETMYVVDSANFLLRKLEKKADGVWHTRTVAGVPGKEGHRDGPGKQALFGTPFDSLVVDKTGVVYTLDGNWLRKFENRRVTTLNGGTGRRNGPLKQALFDRIMGGLQCLACDGEGNLYVADRWGMAIRKVDLKKRVVTTVAGCMPGAEKGRPTDGPALEARFHPGGGPVAVFYNRPEGAIIVRSADEGGRVRWIKDGWMKTFGPGPGRKAKLFGPWKDCVGGNPCGIDAEGNVYLRGSGCIRVVKKKDTSR
jgi:hypothetical protein